MKALLTALLFPAWILNGADYFDETKAQTLFAFDHISIPHTQNLKLEMRQPVKHDLNPVMKRGAPGTVDAHGVQFYGSIIKDGAKYRMWYVAFDDDTNNKVASGSKRLPTPPSHR